MVECHEDEYDALARQLHESIAEHEVGWAFSDDPAMQRGLDGEFGASEGLRALSEAATPGPWKARQGHAPDGFQPSGYKYVQFGPTEAKARGYGTDQLRPEDADLIAAAVNYVRAVVASGENRRPAARETVGETVNPGPDQTT